MRNPSWHTSPLSTVSVWILIILAEGDCYIYAMRDRIWSRTMAAFVPSISTVRSAMLALERQGYIAYTGQEASTSSRFERNLYGITERGRSRLRSEQTLLQFTIQALSGQNYR